MGRLEISLPEPWKVSRTAQGLTSVRRAEVAGAEVFITPSMALEGFPPQDLLMRFISDHAGAREVVREEPEILTPRKNRRGTTLVFRECTFRDMEGRTEEGLFFVLSQGEAGQGIFAVSRDAAALQRIAPFVKEAVETARLSGTSPLARVGGGEFTAPDAQVAGARTPGRGQEIPGRPAPPEPVEEAPQGALAMAEPGKSAFGKTGTRFDEFATVSITAQSARLRPVPFRIRWVRRVENVEARNLDFSRDARGNAYLLHAHQTGLGSRAPIANNVLRFPAEGGNAVLTGITKDVVQQSARQRARADWEVMALAGATSDGQGNLVVGADFYGDLLSGWQLFSGQQVSPVVMPAELARLATATRRDGNVRVEATAEGSVWVASHSDGRGAALALLQREGEDFQARRVELRYAPSLPAPDASDILRGGASADGSWTFYSRGVVWTVRPSELVPRPLARVDIPSEGVSLSNPIVLRNGDIWIAVNQTVGAVASGDRDAYGNFRVRNSSAFLGDRSRWLRLRPKGKQLELAEVSSEGAVQALVKAGFRLEFPRLFSTSRLRFDPATGGILAFESSNGALFVLEP